MRRFAALVALLCAISPALGWFIYSSNVQPAAVNLASTVFQRTECDSLTQNLSHFVPAWPNITLAASTGGLYSLSNAANAGNVVANAASRNAAAITAAGLSAATVKAYTILCGVNDTGNPAYYPATAGAQTLAGEVGTTILDVVGASYTNTVMTQPDFAASSGTQIGSNAWRAAYNTALRALVPSKALVVVDAGGQFPIGIDGIYANTLYFPDGLHFTSRTQYVVEQENVSVVNGLTRQGVAPPTPLGLRAAQLLQNTAVITWQPGFTGGLYNQFVYRYRINGETTWTTWSHDAYSRQNFAIVTGLTAGTAYQSELWFIGPGGTGTATSLGFTTEASTAGTFDVNRSTTSVISNYQTVALSSGNTVATRVIPQNASGALGVAVTSSGVSTGKRYLEFLPLGVDSLETFGVCNAGFINNSVGAFLSSATGGSGASSVNGIFTAVTTINLASWVGGRGMLAIDHTNKKVFLGKNNTWGGSGDPVAGTNPWITWTGDGEIIFPCFGLDYNGTSIQYVGSGFTYTPPTGYTALN